MQKRIFINAKDLMIITGKSKNTAYKLFRTIKDSYKKEFITIKETAKYFDIDETEILALIK